VTSQGALPPIEIGPWKSPWRLMLARVAKPLLIVSALLLLLDHDSSMIIGGLVALVITGLIFAVEFPLIMRAQRRRREKLLRSAPPGTVFVSSATAPAGRPRGDGTKYRRRVFGYIRVGQEGICFTSKSRPPRESVVSWDGVRQLRVTQPLRQPLSARLEVSTTNSETFVWLCTGGQTLTASLTRLAETSVTTPKRM
jgi:hypothetical protein